MKLIDKYLISNILKGVFTVILLLVSISSLLDFIYQLNDVGKGSYYFFNAIIYTILGIPRLIVQILPAAALIGSLLSLGNLSHNHELIVMRAAGISKKRLIKSVSIAGFILLIIMMVLSQSLAPSFGAYAQQYRADKINNSIELSNRDSIWLKDGDNIINIKRSSDSTKFDGIYIYEIENYEKINILSKSEAARIDENNSWVLTNYSETLFLENHIESNLIDQIIKKYNLSPEILSLSEVQHDFLNNKNLSRYINYLEDNGLDSKRYRIAFWSRISESLSVLLMTTLALPFIFSSLRSTSTGRNLITGLLIGLGYYIFSETFINIGEVYNISALMVAWIPTTILLIINYYLIHKIE